MSKQLKKKIEKGEGPLSFKTAYCCNLIGLQHWQPNFKVQCNELTGRELDCSPFFQTYDSTKNMIDIVKCVWRGYTFGADIKQSPDNEGMVVIYEPPEPTPLGMATEVSETQSLTWTNDIDGYVKQRYVNLYKIRNWKIIWIIVVVVLKYW